MPHGHDPHSAPDTVHVGRRLASVLNAAIVVVLICTAAGVVFFWPRGGNQPTGAGPGGLGAGPEPRPTLYDAVVQRVERTPCLGGGPDPTVRCQTITFRLSEGPDRGLTRELEQSEGPQSPALEAGARVVLGHVEDETGSNYYFADFQRRTALTWLAVGFAVVVIALARGRGVRALLGLAVSLFVLLQFVVPAILQGRSAVGVAITGASALMLVSIYLVHGFHPRTTVAVLGTLASLAITGLLAVLFVGLAHLTGFASEEATFLRLSSGELSVQGLLLGGIIIGALGVLDDVTITQVSAVWQIYAADPTSSRGHLYRRALEVGHDHIASTVNTLVLAYAGASLPLLVLLGQAGPALGDVISGELLATEIVRTLVGSIGLVASVPVTTALASLVVTSGMAAGPIEPALPSNDAEA